MSIEEFRRLNAPESIVLTKHGKNRLHERNIKLDDIVSAINNGEIIKEYVDDKPLSSFLVLSFVKGRPLHLVISHDDEFIYLITAYEPNSELWDESFKTKKE